MRPGNILRSLIGRIGGRQQGSQSPSNAKAPQRDAHQSLFKFTARVLGSRLAYCLFRADSSTNSDPNIFEIKTPGSDLSAVPENKDQGSDDLLNPLRKYRQNPNVYASCSIPKQDSPFPKMVIRPDLPSEVRVRHRENPISLKASEEFVNGALQRYRQSEHVYSSSRWSLNELLYPNPAPARSLTGPSFHPDYLVMKDVFNHMRQNKHPDYIRMMTVFEQRNPGVLNISQAHVDLEDGFVPGPATVFQPNQVSEEAA